MVAVKRALFVLVLAGCGDDTQSTAPDAALADAAQPDADLGDGGFQTAPHAPFPQIPTRGGPVLRAPILVTITFPGDPRRTALESFGQWIVGSDWLVTVGDEYGVGRGTHRAAVMPQAAPASTTSDGMVALVAARVADGTLPPPDQGSIYTIYVPATTRLTDFVDFCSMTQGVTAGGYHSEIVASGVMRSYALVPRCTTQPLSEIEVTASHELIEAATDPFPISQPAYEIPDCGDPWGCTEVGDLCESEEVAIAGLTVQRSWSNRAAAAGDPPCLPRAPGEPYFNVDVMPNGRIGVRAGQTATLHLTGWSTTPVADWTLSAFASMFGPASFQPQLTLDTTTLNNGRHATLRVTVPAGTPAGREAHVFVSSSRAAVYTYWPVAIDVQ